MQNPAAMQKAYRKVDVETASQGKLIVMLFSGAIQRCEEAKRRLAGRDQAAAHNNLIRAQDIMTELRGALNMREGGDIAQNLDRIYEYVHHLLVRANVRKQSEPIDEALACLIPMRDTWQELFDQLREEDGAAPALSAPTNAHGAAVLNLRG